MKRLICALVLIVCAQYAYSAGTKYQLKKANKVPGKIYDYTRNTLDFDKSYKKRVKTLGCKKLEEQMNIFEKNLVFHRKQERENPYAYAYTDIYITKQWYNLTFKQWKGKKCGKSK